MKKIGSLTALAVAGLLVAFGALTPASAQNACQGDAYRFCNEWIQGGTPNRGKIASCLFRHRSELSEGCRAVIGGKGKKAGRGHRGGKGKARHRRHR